MWMQGSAPTMRPRNLLIVNLGINSAKPFDLHEPRNRPVNPAILQPFKEDMRASL